jgi:hypothetical protein
MQRCRTPATHRRRLRRATRARRGVKLLVKPLHLRQKRLHALQLLRAVRYRRSATTTAASDNLTPRRQRMRPVSTEVRPKQPPGCANAARQTERRAAINHRVGKARSQVHKTTRTAIPWELPTFAFACGTPTDDAVLAWPIADKQIRRLAARALNHIATKIRSRSYQQTIQRALLTCNLALAGAGCSANAPVCSQHCRQRPTTPPVFRPTAFAKRSQELSERVLNRLDASSTYPNLS